MKFFLASSFVVLAACGREHPSTGLPPEVTVDTIVLSPMPLVAHVADYVFITATVYNGDHQRIAWGNYIENDGASTTADCLVPMTRCTPVPIQVSSPTQFTTMTTGGRSVCGLDAGGEVLCWGSTYDDLGTQFLRLPTKLPTSLRFKSIAAGETHRCGVTIGGAIYCWGNNEAGKIGDYSAVPTPDSPYGKALVISPALVAAP